MGSISDRSSAGFPILCVAEFRDDMIGGGTSTCMVVEFYQVFLCAHNSGYACFHLSPFSLEYIYTITMMATSLGLAYSRRSCNDEIQTSFHDAIEIDGRDLILRF